VLFVGGERCVLPPVIEMNDQRVTPDTPLVDRAQITVRRPQTVRDVLPLLDSLSSDLLRELSEPATIQITVDGQPVTLPYEHVQLRVNGEPVSLDHPLHAEDALDIEKLDPPVYRMRDFYDEAVLPPQRISVIVNNRPITIEGPKPPIFRNGERASLDDPVFHGDRLNFVLPPDKQAPSDWQPILSDVFRYIEIEKERPAQATNLIMTVNALPADFMTPLHHGAVVILEWV
jgi:sulfur carrier protein ThiS